jgi:uncharacterized protein (TIGR02421 family)
MFRSPAPDPSRSNTSPLDPSSGRSGAVVRRALTPAEARIRELSERLAAVQRPLRILDAVRWDDEVEETFFASGCTELPHVDRAWYEARPLPFDPPSKRVEIIDLERDVAGRLGASCPAGRMMLRRCRELLDVVSLLEMRGTSGFAVLSRRLYGGSGDPLPADAPALEDLSRPAGEGGASEELPCLNAESAARILQERLNGYFRDGPPVRVQVSSDLAADAAVVGDALKVRRGGRFSLLDVRVLEVHEGWVHLGTTRNGLEQPVCTFLGKATPAATVTQEGLAVLTEVLAGAAHPARLRRLANRVKATALAEDGGDFLDVFRFFNRQGCDPRESYRHAARIFRGSLPRGCGPCTKDLSYGRGFALVCRLLLEQVRDRQAKRIDLLFCGKTALEEVADLGELADAGLLRPPRRTPPPFADSRRLLARFERDGNAA